MLEWRDNVVRVLAVVVKTVSLLKNMLFANTTPPPRPTSETTFINTERNWKITANK